ncbi:hypothetical protein G7Y89_g1014 [Cudoniella acicularis]|uniref:Protein kinase domain-containing protein n=1 Tax=Cudoniella acicularis TaxID=354080 RepID=A0A8H4W8B8_9HELO|nr:hypothetical protein G7Y89_g1014 [Cudoniella acicularis]
MKSTTSSTPRFFTNSQTIDFTPRTYKENKRKGGTEPKNRSQSFVLYSTYKWHVKVTFQGTLQSTQTATFASITKRQEDLKNLCLCIDLDQIQLLDDTVTELIVMRQDDATTVQGQRLHLKSALDPGSEYTPIAGHLWLSIREDPLRVRFPIYNGSSSGTATRDWLEISKKRELWTGVYEVLVEEKSYVYKEVDKLPNYEVRDSEVLEQELRTLELLRGTEGIVQLVAAVISENPYRTAKIIKDNAPTVLRGILLEYHPYGTLQDVLRLQKHNTEWPLHRWAVQIACALQKLHQAGVTHMDLKPENIVISVDLNAILIDISGCEASHSWLSPEIRNLPDPLSQTITSRKQNDVWALGKIISEIADALYNYEEQQFLRSIALEAMSEIPTRISLRDVICKLS